MVFGVSEARSGDGDIRDGDCVAGGERGSADSGYRVNPLAVIPRSGSGSLRIVGYFGIISEAKVFSRVPRPSISIWMVSPGWTGPTPAGVPVGIRSPGSRVMVAVM